MASGGRRAYSSPNQLARVLVAEDYPALAKVIAIAIQREGHGVERAGSIARALALEGTFDLAVIDLDLRDGWGTELANQLRSEGRLGLVIFLASSSDHEQISTAEAWGQVVTKELGVEPLMTWVRRLLADSEALARVVGADAAPLPKGAGRSGTHKRVRK